MDLSLIATLAYPWFFDWVRSSRFEGFIGTILSDGLQVHLRHRVPTTGLSKNCHAAAQHPEPMKMMVQVESIA